MLASLYRVPLPAGGRPVSEGSRFTARYTTLAVQAFEGGLPTVGQLAERLGTDIVGARAIVAEMTEGYRTGRDGHAERVELDLSADLLGAD